MTAPTDTELLDWLTRERCSLTCWDVGDGSELAGLNGWTCEGAEGLEDRELPQGPNARDAIAWAMKLHAQGKFKTRTQQLREENEGLSEPGRGADTRLSSRTASGERL